MLGEEVKDGGFYQIDAARQLISFYGDESEIRGINDTDLDAFREYNGNLYIFKECKKSGIDPPYGQRKAFKSLVDIIRKGGAMAFYIIYDHNVPNSNIIYQKEQYVREYYNGKRWIKPQIPLTVHDANIKFEKFAKSKGLSL